MTPMEQTIATDRLRRALLTFQAALWAEPDQQIQADTRVAATEVAAAFAAFPEAEQVMSSADRRLVATAQCYLGGTAV